MGLSAQLLSSSDPKADTLFRRITPLDDQMNYLQEKWHELADELLQPLSARFSLPTSTWIQGSYKYQTLLRPFAGEEFDLDLGFYYAWAGAGSYGPKQLKDGVQARLGELVSSIEDAREVVVPPKERCCRLRYGKSFHIDVPVYHLNDATDSRRLAAQSNVWESSDPKILYKWFREKIVRTDRQQVRRLTCYLKAWSRLKLSGDARPSSILLTVLILDAVYEPAFRTDLDDDEALLAGLCSIKTRLAASPIVPNPVDRSENLNRMSAEGLATFARALDNAITFARVACGAPDLLRAAQAWEWLFAYMVPFPDTVTDTRLREASRSLSVVEPDVRVRMLSSADHLIGIATDAVSARKDYFLEFQVANSSAFPAGSHYSWTVRNAGSEAEGVNDLGHTREGTNKTSVREHTVYNGRQFMDLTIRDKGRLVGFKRIPVDISGPALPSPYKRRQYGPR